MKLLAKTLPSVTSNVLGPNTPSLFFLSLKLAPLRTVLLLQSSTKYFPYPIFTGIPAVEGTPCHFRQTDQIWIIPYFSLHLGKAKLFCWIIAAFTRTFSIVIKYSKQYTTFRKQTASFFR